MISETIHCIVKFGVLMVVLVKIRIFEMRCNAHFSEELAALIFGVQEFQKGVIGGDDKSTGICAVYEHKIM